MVSGEGWETRSYQGEGSGGREGAKMISEGGVCSRYALGKSTASGGA
jgi:hypothetical protein